MSVAGSTTAEVIRRSSEYLASHGVESPRATAEALLMQLLGTDRAGLYSRRDGLDASTAKLLGRALCRRCAGTPLQHLTGEQQFLELSLVVAPGVFVPRPETEGLVLAALEVIENVAGPVVVDVGTGTGAIGLAIAARRPDARVLATDISTPAVLLARANAGRLGLAVDVREGDVFGPLPKPLRGGIDLVVSNPPYVDADAFDALPLDVKAEPYDALVGGLDVYRRLAAEASSWLRPGGWLVVEIGETQAEDVRGLLASIADRVDLRQDLAGRDRVVRARLGERALAR